MVAHPLFFLPPSRKFHQSRTTPGPRQYHPQHGPPASTCDLAIILIDARYRLPLLKTYGSTALSSSFGWSSAIRLWPI